MTLDPHRGQPVLTSGPKLTEATGAIILLHGRGATADDILGLGRGFGQPGLACFAPQAAENTWYPNSFLAPIEQNEPWLTSALKRVEEIVAGITSAGVGRERIVISGFSQGACLASEFVARHAGRYGALIAFSGGLIGPPGTKFHYDGEVRGTPVFLGGVDPDPHVPWQRVEESASILSGLGAEVTLRRYPGMPHTIIQDEIREARSILGRALGVANVAAAN